MSSPSENSIVKLPLAKVLVKAYIKANPSLFPIFNWKKYKIEYHIKYFAGSIFCQHFDFTILNINKAASPRYYSLDPQLLDLSEELSLAKIKKKGLRNERNFRRRARAHQRTIERQEIRSLKVLADKWGFILTLKEEEK